MNLRAQLKEQNLRTIHFNHYLDGQMPANTRSILALTAQSHPNHLHTQPLLRNSSELSAKDPDDLRLQEFLRIVMRGSVGGKARQGGGADQGGAGLMGTQEYQTAKIYNTLGVKRSRTAVRRENSQQLVHKHPFLEAYRPLNLFPARKQTLKRPPRSERQTAPVNPKRRSEGELKGKLLKILRGESSPSALSRRRDSPPRSSTARLRSAQVLCGVRMVLHCE